MMSEVFITGIVFFGVYSIIKLISDHLLKRKLIKAGQYEKVGILEPIEITSEAKNRFPSLKWGLVALMAGLGLILVEILQHNEIINYRKVTMMPFGILLVSIALGFLIYFFIVNKKQK